MASLVVDLQHPQLQLPVLLRVCVRELHVRNDALQAMMQRCTAMS